jgi:hypothetical protein
MTVVSISSVGPHDFELCLRTARSFSPDRVQDFSVLLTTTVHTGLYDAGEAVLNSAGWPGKMTALPYSSDSGSMPAHFGRLAEPNCIN